MDDYIYPSSDLSITTQIRILDSRLTYCDYPTDFNRIVVRIKHLGGTITGNIDTLYQKCVERRLADIRHSLSTMQYIDRKSGPREFMQIGEGTGQVEYHYFDNSGFEDLVDEMTELTGKPPENVDELRKSAIERRTKSLLKQLMEPGG
jgi:hypothetical protein